MCRGGEEGGGWGVKQGSSLLVRARFHNFSRYFQGLQSFFKVLVYGNVCVWRGWGGVKQGSSFYVMAKFQDFSRYFQGLQSFFKVLVYGKVSSQIQKHPVCSSSSFI